MWVQGSTYSQPRHWKEVEWLVLRSAAFTPEERPRYSFYRRLSGPQDQSGHEGAKKNLHPSDTRDRTRAVQPVAQRLAAWATWPYIKINPTKYRLVRLLSLELWMCALHSERFGFKSKRKDWFLVGICVSVVQRLGRQCVKQEIWVSDPGLN